MSHNLLQAPLESRPLKEDAAAAPQTAQANISTEANDLPVAAAARMSLPEPKDIAELELEDGANPLAGRRYRGGGG